MPSVANEDALLSRYERSKSEMWDDGMTGNEGRIVLLDEVCRVILERPQADLMSSTLMIVHHREGRLKMEMESWGRGRP